MYLSHQNSFWRHQQLKKIMTNKQPPRSILENYCLEKVTKLPAIPTMLTKMVPRRFSLKLCEIFWTSFKLYLGKNHFSPVLHFKYRAKIFHKTLHGSKVFSTANINKFCFHFIVIIYFKPMFPFYTPGKKSENQNFSGGIK